MWVERADQLNCDVFAPFPPPRSSEWRPPAVHTVDHCQRTMCDFATHAQMMIIVRGIVYVFMYIPSADNRITRRAHVVAMSWQKCDQTHMSRRTRVTASGGLRSSRTRTARARVRAYCVSSWQLRQRRDCFASVRSACGRAGRAYCVTMLRDNVVTVLIITLQPPPTQSGQDTRYINWCEHCARGMRMRLNLVVIRCWTKSQKCDCDCLPLLKHTHTRAVRLQRKAEATKELHECRHNI